jgi:hypothetical protein
MIAFTTINMSSINIRQYQAITVDLRKTANTIFQNMIIPNKSSLYCGPVHQTRKLKLLLILH